MPQRIQRKRTKGWTTPLCSCGCGKKAIYVGRPTRWGNDFVIDRFASRGSTLWRVLDWRIGAGLSPDAWWATSGREAAEIATRRFREELTLDLAELRGHDLMCWCPLFDKDGNRVPCHADVLLELANQGEVR